MLSENAVGTAMRVCGTLAYSELMYATGARVSEVARLPASAVRGNPQVPDA